MATSSEEKPLPTLGDKIRPTRSNARESKEVNAKIFELVVNQMNLEKGKEGSGKKGEGMSEYENYNIPPDIEPCHNLLRVSQGMQNIMDRTYRKTEPFSADDYAEMQSLINELKYLIYQK